MLIIIPYIIIDVTIITLLNTVDTDRMILHCFFSDTSGHVRVWDTTQKEHILKIDHSALGGAVKDIDWTMDNQRLVDVGEGRET